MAKTVILDQDGRIALPKDLRDSLGLKAGDKLSIASDRERITLLPVRPQATLEKEQGIWVYQGEPSDQCISDLIDRERNKRIRKICH
jgi:AbrB family looped-hinge helix DNA binding protein